MNNNNKMQIKSVYLAHVAPLHIQAQTDKNRSPRRLQT